MNHRKEAESLLDHTYISNENRPALALAHALLALVDVIQGLAEDDEIYD